MPRRTTSCKWTANKEAELDMQEKQATPVVDIETILPTTETAKTTESTNSNSLMEFMREAFKQMKEDNETLNKKIDSNNETLKPQMEKNNETLKKQMKEDNETLSKKIDSNNETLKQQMERNKKALGETLRQQLEDYTEQVKQQIMETNKRIESTNEVVLQFREDLINQINNVEDNNKIRVEILQQETQEKLKKLNDKMEEQIEHIGNDLGQVRHQVTHNKERIEDIQKRELINIREELEMLRNRPISYTHIPLGEGKETINFKDYNRNPLEFLERIEELIS